MKGQAGAANAAAVILYRQVDRDDNNFSEDVYLRIKILSTEGQQYADVAIPYNGAGSGVSAIKARTIHPDGSVVPFSGTIYDKTLAKTRGVKVSAKVFTFPDVQVGSIIEYRYRHGQYEAFRGESEWTISDALYTRRAKFSLMPFFGVTLRYSWPNGLPEGTPPLTVDHGKLMLECHDVPSFVAEEDMPPEGALKYRVRFTYQDRSLDVSDPTEYWKRRGRQEYLAIEKFVDRRSAMEKAVAQVVTPGDTPEQKLRKIYERVRSLRNTTFERAKTEQELERADQKDAKDVEEVWRRSYGSAGELTWLFLALARAAGIPADPVLIETRDVALFDVGGIKDLRFNASLVRVMLDNQPTYIEPGVVLTPYGELPWYETAVNGFIPAKDGGTWVRTPISQSADAQTRRDAHLELRPDGSLKGHVTVTYTGLEASSRRIAQRHAEEPDRRRYLEEAIRQDLSSGAEVELTNEPAWDNPQVPLVAEYDLAVSGWASRAGQRLVMSAVLFAARDARRFERTMRVHPIYFEHAYEVEDDVAIRLPDGTQVSGSPNVVEVDRDALAYRMEATTRDSTLRIQRRIRMKALLVEASQYDAVRDFYQAVRTTDSTQLVIAAATPQAGAH